MHALASAGWRPMDCELLDDYSAQIEKWVVSAAELLGDRAVAVALRMACPSCGETWSYRRAGAEVVRAWALRLDESGCACSVCRAFWPPDQFEFLARLLGCEPLPT